MKRYFFFLILVCSALQINIFAQEVNVNHEVHIYKTVDDYQLKVDCFFTSDSQQQSNSPSIAFFHGGGWAYGSSAEFYSFCTRYARKGFITFSFEYRLSINKDGSVPHPGVTPVECVKDARSAMRWLRENADKLSIDPDRIVAAGQSVGGQLALSTALLDSINETTDHLELSTVPNALLLFSSNVNTIEAWADKLMGERRSEIWSISPHHNMKKGLPPTIAFHGTEDHTVPFWVVHSFIDKARMYGNEIEFIPLEGRNHRLGVGNTKYGPYFDEKILEMTDSFLSIHGFMPCTKES